MKKLHNMQSMRRHLCALAIGFLALSAHADDAYPSHPITIVVGSEAGSAPDALARIVAKELGPMLRQAVVVDNKPGAAGTIGATLVSNASPDGYTLLMGTVSNVALAPLFYPVKYTPVEGFTPIGQVASVPLVLIASPTLKVHNLAALMAKAKAMPAGAQLTYASPGVGGPQHLAGVLLQHALGAPMLHVPYKSGGAAVTAVVGGQVQVAFVGLPVAAGLAQGGKVAALMVTSPKRSALLPNAATPKEVGLPALEIDNWHVLLAPPHLPEAIRNKLDWALQQVLAMPAVQQQFQKAGAEAMPSSSAQLGKMIAAEAQRWDKVVKDNKLTPNG